jgi:hypothetical protein
MFDDILQAANLYDDGLKRVLSRREQWLSKHAEIRDHLKEIASYLNDNAAYKQVFYVDSLHAFDEVISGTCTDMPSITFRSGDMPRKGSGSLSTLQLRVRSSFYWCRTIAS